MTDRPLKILTTSSTKMGWNDNSFTTALRHSGHLVNNISPTDYIPNEWKTLPLRIALKAAYPYLVNLYNQAIIDEARLFKPNLFFVFKGNWIKPETLDYLKTENVTLIQFYPDTGFKDHGPYIEKAITKYDWVFTTKKSGVKNLAQNFNFSNSSFIPHSFDREIHKPQVLTTKASKQYKSDICFLGNVSAKKNDSMEAIVNAFPKKLIKIWGPNAWRNSPSQAIRQAYQMRILYGEEYAAAMCASKITIALLFEGNQSAISGDTITARTFEIPATGSFMLHERTDDVLEYFEEDKEIVCFTGNEELLDKIKFYLTNESVRQKIAALGYKRAINSDYSYDAKVKKITTKYQELRK